MHTTLCHCCTRHSSSSALHPQVALHKAVWALRSSCETARQRAVCATQASTESYEGEAHMHTSDTYLKLAGRGLHTPVTPA